jgi:hypothetical protein
MSDFVIYPQTSILSCAQWAAFAYQPCASELAGRWQAVNLPPGMTCDENTGLVSGVPTMGGVFEIELLTQRLSDNAVARLKVPLEVRALSGTRHATADLQVNVQTGVLTGSPIMGKQEDDLFLYVRFMRGGLPAQVTVSALSVVLKDEDVVLVQSNSWTAFDGAYLLHVPLYGLPIQRAVNSESHRLAAEISWQETVDWGLPITTLTHTTRTFAISLEPTFATRAADIWGAVNDGNCPGTHRWYLGGAYVGNEAEYNAAVVAAAELAQLIADADAWGQTNDGQYLASGRWYLAGVYVGGEEDFFFNQPPFYFVARYGSNFSELRNWTIALDATRKASRLPNGNDAVELQADCVVLADAWVQPLSISTGSHRLTFSSAHRASVGCTITGTGIVTFNNVRYA